MSAPLTVAFGLLGSMELRVDGQPAKLPAPAERTLLALLLLAPGRTVSTSTLMDRLWSEGTLPDHPANALQLRVSKLRRALAALGLDLVHREASGYRADVNPSAVDLHVFTDRIRQARAESARGGASSPAVVELYGQALELWRGDPLADFAGEMWATVEAARLTQLRLGALAEHAQVALALGRHSDVAASLEPVIKEQPQQEALVGLLMTALYQAGRQAEAVEVFLRTQRSLDEELGLQSSAQLRALYQRVLQQDPQLSPPPAPGPFAAAAGDPEQPSVLYGVPTSALIGRDDATRAVTELLAATRLVTLVGPGGAGKTSLATAIARDLGRTFEHGARVVHLASVDRPVDVPLAVAQAVGVPTDGANPTVQVRDRLLAYLQNRRMLVVIDNCEHVVDAAARLVDTMASTAPGLVILATSREALAVTGEVQYSVGPLAVPPEGTAPAEVPTFASAQLLLERARAVRADLTPTDDELLAVGQICRQLDGMPLALELAASRVVSLGFAEVAARLADRFSLLTTGPRTANDRHRTLRGTVEWSHTLLTAQEQVVFRRLAIFQGGWTLAAAEAVVPGTDIAPGDVLDVLSGLVARSMVISELGATSRFRMLETLRHYALERLHDSGEFDTVAARHASYVLALAEAADADLRGGRQHEALHTLRRENANVRAALRWLTNTAGHADEALRLGGALGLYWHLGHHVEGREVLRALLRDVPTGGAAARARALQAVSLVERPRACLVHPSRRCGETAAESLDLFLTVGDVDGAALSQVLLAVQFLGGSEADRFEELVTAAQRHFDACDDPWGHAVVAFVRLQHFLLRGDRLRARAAGRAARDAFRALDDRWGLSAVLYHLGWGLREFGDYAEAVAVLEEAIEVALSAEMLNTAQWAMGDVALALVYLGENDAAATYFDRARGAAVETGDGAGGALADHGKAVQARMRGESDAARPLYTRALDGFRRLDTPTYAAHAAAGLAWCDLEQKRTDSARERYEDLHRTGEALHEPVITAIALEGLAQLDAAEGRREGAVAKLMQARSMREVSGRPATPAERAQLDAIARELRLPEL